MKRIIVFLVCSSILGCLQGAALKERPKVDTKQTSKMALLYTALRDATPFPEAVIKITADYHGTLPFLPKAQEFLLKKPISCVTFMGNRGVVVGNSNNNKLQFFDIKTGHSTEIDCKQRGQITAVAHVSGFDIATGSKGTWGGVGALRIWCVRTGEMKASFLDDPNSFDRHITSLTVTNNLLFAACNADSSTLRVYDLHTRKLKAAPEFAFENIQCFLPNYDDSAVIGFSKGAIRFFDKTKLKTVEEMSGRNTSLTSVARVSERELIVIDEGRRAYLMMQRQKSSDPVRLEHYEHWETKKPLKNQEIPSKYPIKHVMNVNNEVVGIQSVENRNIVCKFSQKPFGFLDDGNETISFPGEVTKTAVSQSGNLCAVVSQESHDALIGKDIISTVHVLGGGETQEAFDGEYAAWIASQPEQSSSCVVS